jgi:hypothetical protein
MYIHCIATECEFVSLLFLRLFALPFFLNHHRLRSKKKNGVPLRNSIWFSKQRNRQSRPCRPWKPEFTRDHFSTRVSEEFRNHFPCESVLGESNDHFPFRCSTCFRMELSKFYTSNLKTIKMTNLPFKDPTPKELIF